MLPQLTWIDLTATDRDKIRRVLDLFKEQGKVDQLGLGGLRDVFSNVLFPNTTVLHRQPRYLLFIPWCYRELGDWRNGYGVPHLAYQTAAETIDALADGNDPVVA